MESVGKLVICVKKANLTHDTELMGKMDPYVVLKVGKVQQKTTVKPDAGKNPIWNESFEFPTRNGDSLELTVYDKEESLSDDVVGRTDLLLNTDALSVKQDYWLPLFFGKKKEKGGEVLLEMEYKVAEKNILVTILEGRKLELENAKNNQTVLEEEVEKLKQNYNVLTKDYENLKASSHDEKNNFNQDHENYSEKRKKEVELINQITEMKDFLRKLELERVNLVQEVEEKAQKVTELSNNGNALLEEMKSLKGKVSEKLTKEVHPHAGVVAALVLFAGFVIGSRF